MRDDILIERIDFQKIADDKIELYLEIIIVRIMEMCKKKVNKMK